MFRVSQTLSFQQDFLGSPEAKLISCPVQKVQRFSLNFKNFHYKLLLHFMTPENDH